MSQNEAFDCKFLEAFRGMIEAIQMWQDGLIIHLQMD